MTWVPIDAFTATPSVLTCGVARFAIDCQECEAFTLLVGGVGVPAAYNVANPCLFVFVTVIVAITAAAPGTNEAVDQDLMPPGYICGPSDRVSVRREGGVATNNPSVEAENEPPV